MMVRCERYIRTMTSNLVPTPRVDKNGRTVIRHMKQEVQSESSSPLSTAAPSIATEKPTEALAQEIMDTAYFMMNEYSEWEGLSTWQFDEIGLFTDRSHLLRIQDVLTDLLENHQDFIGGMVGQLGKNSFDEISVNLAYAHRDLIMKHWNHSPLLMSLYRTLGTCGISPDPDTKRIEHLEAHFKAELAYQKHVSQSTDKQVWGRNLYLRNKEWVKAVEDNAHRIDDLLDYREQFPIEYVHEDHLNMAVKETFSQAHFEEYLNDGALRSGHL